MMLFFALVVAAVGTLLLGKELATIMLLVAILVKK